MAKKHKTRTTTKATKLSSPAVAVKRPSVSAEAKWRSDAAELILAQNASMTSPKLQSPPSASKDYGRRMVASGNIDRSPGRKPSATSSAKEARVSTRTADSAALKPPASPSPPLAVKPTLVAPSQALKTSPPKDVRDDLRPHCKTRPKDNRSKGGGGGGKGFVPWCG